MSATFCVELIKLKPEEKCQCQYDLAAKLLRIPRNISGEFKRKVPYCVAYGRTLIVLLAVEDGNFTPTNLVPAKLPVFVGGIQELGRLHQGSFLELLLFGLR